MSSMNFPQRTAGLRARSFPPPEKRLRSGRRQEEMRTVEPTLHHHAVLLRRRKVRILWNPSRKYQQSCIEGVLRSAEYTSNHSSLACGSSVDIEDHIRDLCARLISASEDE